MMGSLQEALLKSGLADESQTRKSARRDDPDAVRSRSGSKLHGKPKPESRRNGGRPPRKTSESSDLARAYQARQQAEKQEREAKKQAKVAAQELRRKRNQLLDQVISGNSLNRKNADVPRYFEHLGRIRRVLCTQEQREQLNAGEIGVVNLRGSYLLVSLDTLAAYRAIAPDLVPDLNASEPEDDGSHYPPVPDDLIW